MRIRYFVYELHISHIIMYINTHISTYVHIHKYIHEHTRTHIYIYIRTHIYIYIRTRIYIYIHVYIYIRICKGTIQFSKIRKEAENQEVYRINNLKILQMAFEKTKVDKVLLHTNIYLYIYINRYYAYTYIYEYI